MKLIALGLACLVSFSQASEIRSQENDGKVTGQLPEDEPVLQPDPEVEEALQVLDEAGVPPSQEELAGFMKATRDFEARPGNGISSFPLSGIISLRVGRYQGEGWDRYGKLNLSSRWLRIRGRVRQYRDGYREFNGTLEGSSGPVEFRVGTLGLAQGYGLLVGAPGRGGTLAADQGMKPRRARLVSWVGSPDPRALVGLGGRVHRGPWSVAFLRGRPSPETGEGLAPVSALQVTGAGRSWQLNGAVMEGPQGRGASLSWGIGAKPLIINVETMAWQPQAKIPPTIAAVGHLSWLATRDAGFEIQLGFANLGEGPQMASRPAVLPAWSGRGFALRGFVPLGDRVRMRALVYRGLAPDRSGVTGVDEKSLADIQVGRKLTREVEFRLQYRRSGRRRREWSPRFPWQPAHPVPHEIREVMTGQVVWERSGARARMVLRTLGLSTPDKEGRRTLAGLSGRLALNRSWRVKGNWTTAWGDPVDLVSAVSPMTGMVLPRHWGHWRSETIVGLEWRNRGARLQGAGSLRVPEPEMTLIPLVTFWVQAELSW